MRVTTKGRYALRAILNLATSYNKKPIPIKQIAEEEDISPEFLEQIFFRLKKADIISSVRGPGGGFVLNRDLADISLKDLFEAVGEGLSITPCTAYEGSENGKECAKKDNCAAYKVWKDTSNHILQYLDGLSLEQILSENGNNGSDKLIEQHSSA